MCCPTLDAASCSVEALEASKVDSLQLEVRLALEKAEEEEEDETPVHYARNSGPLAPLMMIQHPNSSSNSSSSSIGDNDQGVCLLALELTNASYLAVGRGRAWPAQLPCCCWAGPRLPARLLEKLVTVNLNGGPQNLIPKSPAQITVLRLLSSPK